MNIYSKFVVLQRLLTNLTDYLICKLLRNTFDSLALLSTLIWYFSTYGSAIGEFGFTSCPTIFKFWLYNEEYSKLEFQLGNQPLKSDTINCITFSGEMFPYFVAYQFFIINLIVISCKASCIVNICD